VIKKINKLPVVRLDGSGRGGKTIFAVPAEETQRNKKLSKLLY